MNTCHRLGGNDTVTGVIKREGVKVLYDKMITLQQRVGTTTGTHTAPTRFFKKFYLKSKKGGKLSWGQDGLLQNKPVGLWVVPYDHYAALRTDILGKLTFTAKMYFKDV